MTNYISRRSFIGGSDARFIMGGDEAALVRLWREKRCEAEPEDLSGNLIVQLGRVTEALNRHWYERNTRQTVECVQHRLRHPVLRWMGATLDGIVAGSAAVFETKFMLPWSFSEEAAVEKHMAQPQHNIWVVASRCYSLGRGSLPFVCRSFRRTPGPPPFSSMNSMPARFNTFSIRDKLAGSPAYRFTSMFVMVFRCNPVASARSRTVQFKAARAILTCALVTGIWLCYCHMFRCHN